ncbi:MAG TPA: DUF3800 domain-containing protein [Candidatus Sumerlaeota bacterium]|nr:DUF3800 domain-containing protein [Candidatus Sumerlaeota bacterium]
MLYFIDESGHDHKESPYEVLAAVAIAERDLWNLILSIRSAELEFFGVRLADVGIELKGKKLLKRKIFRLAGEGEPVSPTERLDLVRTLLLRNFAAKKKKLQIPPKQRELISYGQAVLAFVGRVLAIMAQHRVKTFAALVETSAPHPVNNDFLRRDYAFLFERFYYHLQTLDEAEMGLIVFDELEKVQSRILLEQMGHYFLDTGKGTLRSARIVPEPFFVHSDLTTAVQLADLLAYTANWAIRLNRMDQPKREELVELSDMFFDLRFVGRKEKAEKNQEWPVYGMFYLDDLRPRSERPI